MTIAHQEIEMKFLLEKAQVAQILAAPLLQTAGASQVRELVVSIYYDTALLELRRNGFSYRVRKVGNRWLQTVKGKGTRTDGYVRRFELEQEIESEQPRFDLLSAPNLHPFFQDGILLGQMRPIFVTEFERISWRLEMGQGSLVEVALDQGVIKMDQQQEMIRELEIESIHGVPDAILWAAKELQRTVAMVPGGKSKGQRGYEMVRGQRLANDSDEAD